MDSLSDTYIPEILERRIRKRSANVAVIGLGYVGLPLAAAVSAAGFRTIGLDIDSDKIERINSGCSYIDAVESRDLSELVSSGRFRAMSDFQELAACDVIVVCVPTPLTRHREPDLRFVETTMRNVARHLTAGQMVVLESTTYPGTTEEIVKPILQESGLRAGRDFFLAFSPEREDPGNDSFRTRQIPKIVAGDGAPAGRLAELFYAAVVDEVVAVSSPKTAEAVKITENVFRSVNIALVNELKVVYDAMGIDIWEVIEAAATKPFGYMPFYPGPGLGGHCIPIDPFYLSWKSREYGQPTRFIELAGEINIAMPRHVISRLEHELDRSQGVSLGAARILVIGLAYKKNVSDIRESPSFALMELLEARGTEVDFHDPHVRTIPVTREHAAFTGRKSLDLSPEAIGGYHAILVATDHDAVDYALLRDHSRLIVDTRNAMASRGLAGENVRKA